MQTIKFNDAPDTAQQAYLTSLPMSKAARLMGNLHELEKPLQLFDNCIAMATENLNRAMDDFWGLPDEQLLPVLDYYGPTRVQAIFTAHASRAKQLDAIREQRGLTPMAKIGAQKPVTVNPETGKFELVPPPVEESLPEN